MPSNWPLCDCLLILKKKTQHLDWKRKRKKASNTRRFISTEPRKLKFCAEYLQLPLWRENLNIFDFNTKKKQAMKPSVVLYSRGYQRDKTETHIHAFCRLSDDSDRKRTRTFVVVVSQTVKICLYSLTMLRSRHVGVI